MGLQIETKPVHENAEEWDEDAQADVDIMPSIRGLEALRLPQLQMQQFQGVSHSHRNSTQPQPQTQLQSQSGVIKMQHRLPGLIFNQVLFYLLLIY